MEILYVDTALLAVPNFAVDGQTAKEIIDRVNHFAQLAVAGIPIRFVIASGAEELIWGNNYGPDFNNVESFIEFMGLGDFFTARDLVQQYQTILERSSRADNVSPLEVRTISHFSTFPELPGGLGPNFLANESQRIFASVAALQSLEEVAWKIGSAIQGVNDSSFITTVCIEEVSGRRATELGELPVDIVGEVRAISHMRDFLSADAAYRFWQNAETAEDLHFAITIAALALLKEAGRECEIANLRPFTIGPLFLESLRVCQCFGAGRFASAALTLCAQLVARLCQRPIGVFGRPQQDRSFDDLLGWRVHLTKGAEGLRLMFWGDGKIVEFANVGVKHELEIAVGHRSGAVFLDLTAVI